MKNKITISFNSEEVRKHLICAMRATYHMPTIGEIANAAFHRNGILQQTPAGFPDLGNVDYTKVGPRLWFCKDDYVYLMSNNKPVIGDPGSVLPPAYAFETDPRKFDFHTCHQTAAKLLGDGMQWISIPANDLIKAVRRHRTLKVEVLDRHPGVLRMWTAEVARWLGLSDIAFTVVVPRS